MARDISTCSLNSDCLPGHTCKSLSDDCSGIVNPVCEKGNDTDLGKYFMNSSNENCSSSFNCSKLAKSLSKISGLCNPLTHVDLTQFSKMESLQFYKKMSNAYTMGMWLFIESISQLNSKLINFTLKNLMMVSVGAVSPDVVVYCTPFITYYPALETIYNTSTMDQKVSTSYYGIGKASVAHIANRWLYVSCGFNLEALDMTIMMQNDSMPTFSKADINLSTRKPKYYMTPDIDIDFFCRSYQKTYLSIKHGSDIYDISNRIGSVFLRQLSVFTDKIPVSANFRLHYYDLSSVGSNSQMLKSLWIYGIDVQVKNTATMTVYVYNTTFSRISKVSTVVTYLANAQFTIPPQFYRLNLPPVNKYYTECGLISLGSLSCISPGYICWDNDSPISCRPSWYYDLSQATATGVCQGTCSDNMMPQIGTLFNTQSTMATEGYCTSPCGVTVDCLSSSDYPNYSNKYHCTDDNEFTNLNYYCIETTKLENGALFFSRYFGSAFNIKIPISPTLPTYSLEFWFFFDKVYSPSKQNPDIPNYIWFTSGLKIRKESSDHSINNDFNMYDKNFTKVNTIPYTFNMGQWYRILYSISQGMFDFYSTEDGMLKSWNKSIINDDLDLSLILFCNDNKCPLSTGPNIYWSSGFYRNIKVWNDSALNVSFFREYEKYFKFFNVAFPRFANVKYYYPLNLNNIKRFKITDPHISTNEALFEYPPSSNELSSSPFPGYNYSIAFDLTTDENAGKYISGFALANDVYSPVLGGTCSNNCKYCRDNSECHECVQGYLLIGGTCTTVKDLKYYLRSPVFSNGSPVDLVFIPMLMQTTKAFSLSFFIKVLGATTSPSYDIMRLGADLKLSYDTSSDKLQLVNASTGAAYGEYASYSSRKGIWTNISIAYSCDANIISYFPAMVNFQVNFSGVIISPIPEGLRVSAVTIPKESIAIYAKIWIWDVYITGPWSEMVNTDRKFTPIKLADGLSSSCLDSTDVALPVGPYTNPCIADYGNDNPLIGTEDALNETSKWCSLNVSFADLSGCKSPDLSCRYGFYSIRAGNTPSNLCGCASDPSIKDAHIWKNSGYNYCALNDAQDFGQMSSLRLEAVQTGSVEYTLEFWVYMQTYVQGQFLGFDIAWNSQLKIKLGYSSSVYTSECFPFYQEGNASYTQSEKISFPTLIQWINVRCAVNKTAALFHHFHHLQVTSELSLLNLPGPAVPDTTSLVFTNHSLNRGIIFMRQIRLWKCYLCQMPNIYRVIIQTSANYPNLLHLWDLPSSGSIPDNKGDQDMTVVVDGSWIGYNILDDSAYVNISTSNILCEESNQLCNTMIKLNQIDDLNIVVDPSPYGRYTLELWTAVDSLANLNIGYHIIWKNLVSISVVKSSKDSGTLNIYCWPQDFRLNLENIYESNEINALTSTVINFDIIETANYPNKKWMWIRCAVSYNKNEFYLNNRGRKSLVGDFMGSDEHSSVPIRYFWRLGEKTRLSISGAKKSTSANIYIRNVYLFNDYLPQTYLFSHTNMQQINSSVFPSLIFSINFWGFWKQLNLIPTIDNSLTTKYIPVFLTPMTLDESLLVEQACDVGKKFSSVSSTCEDINVCDTSTINKCEDENTPLVCKSSYHYNPLETKCSQVCSGGLMRSPSSSQVTAICNMSCDGNYVKCPDTAEEELNIYLSANCKSGYTRYGYRCIEDTIATNQAFLYFNGCTNFPNGYYSFISDTRIQNAYILSFWVKLDRFNEWCSFIGKKKVYFLLEPHVIYLDTETAGQSNNSIYNLVYEYLLDTKIRGTLLSFNPWNWNYIVIHYHKPSKFLKLYSNYNILVPDLNFENLLDTYDFTLSQLIFCSGKTSNSLCSSFESLDNISWGAAFYKSLKVFEGLNANPWLALESELKTFSDGVNFLYYEFPFNIKNAVNSDVANIWIPGQGLDFYNFYRIGNLDKDLIINYSMNFDYAEQHYGKYVSTLDLQSGKLTESNCAENCKRCVSNKSTSCVECTAGYKLFSGMCKSYTGYFIKTPMTQYPKKLIHLNSKAFSESTMTWTIWIKFFGQLQTSSASCGMILRLKVDGTRYICYNAISLNLIFFDGTNPLFQDSIVFNSFIGQWVMLSFATMMNQRWDIPGLENYFAPISRFYVQNTEVSRNKNYIYTTPGIGFDSFDIGNEISALFSDLKVYSSFIVNPFGYVFSQNSKNGLANTISLMSKTAESRCISDTQLNLNLYADIPLDRERFKYYVEQLGISCAADYNPYISITCGFGEWVDKTYLLIKDPPCASCPSVCNGLCAYYDSHSPSNSCVCSSYNADSWLQVVDKTSEKLSCEKVPQYDFSRGITAINGVNVASEGKYTIEFWLYIYSYNKNTIAFDSFEVIWDLHNYVKIYNGGNNSLYVQCSPIYDHWKRNQFIGPEVYTTNTINNELLQGYSIYGFSDDLKGEYFKWVYVQCSTNIPRNIFSLNNRGNLEIKIEKSIFPNLKATNQSQLIFQPGYKANVNYGFLFIRELKLWAQWDIRKFTSTCNNTNKALWLFRSTILHYFKGTNSPGNSIKDYLKPYLGGSLDISPYFLGYNTIEDVTTESLLMPPLVNCYEIFVLPIFGYNNSTTFLFSIPDSPQVANIEFSYRQKDTEDVKDMGSSLNGEITYTFTFPEAAFRQSSEISVEIYSKITFLDNTSSIAYLLFSLNRNIPVNNLSYAQMLVSDITCSLTDEQLYNRAKLISSLSTDLNITFANFDNFPIFKLVLLSQDKSDSAIRLIPPDCDENPNFCNGRGICYKVFPKLFCKCNFWTKGDTCQILKRNIRLLDSMISSILVVLNSRITSNNSYSIAKLNTVRNLLTVKSKTSEYLTDIIPFLQIAELLINPKIQTQIKDELRTTIKEVTEILNLLYKLYLSHLVKQKYTNLENYVETKNSTLDYSKINYQVSMTSLQSNNSTLRKMQLTDTTDIVKIVTVNDTSVPYLALTTDQQKMFSSFLSQIENSIMTVAKELIKAEFGTDFQYNFTSTELSIVLKKISHREFDFMNYFSLLNKTQNHEAYFDANEYIRCYFQSNTNPIFMVYIEYKIPPREYDIDMLGSLITTNHKILFLDSAGEEVNIQCDKNIVHYLPLFPLQNSAFFNNYNAYPSKYNQLSQMNAKTIYPFYYIFPNGTIDHSDFSNQFERYYNNFNLFLMSYQDDLPGYTEVNLTKANITYINTQCYFVGFSSHLGEFGAFTKFNTLIQYDSNFFFIYFPQILNCGENYLNNPCFYIIVIIFGFYLILLILAFLFRNCQKVGDDVDDFISAQRVEMCMIQKDNERFGDNRYSFHFPQQNEEVIPIEKKKFCITEEDINNNNVSCPDDKRESATNFRKLNLPKGSSSKLNMIDNPENPINEDQKDQKMLIIGNKPPISHDIGRKEIQTEYINDLESRGSNHLKLGGNDKNEKGKFLSNSQRISNFCYNPLFFIFTRNVYSNSIIMKSSFMPRYLYISKIMLLIYLELTLVTIMMVFVDYNFIDSASFDSGKFGGYIIFAVFAANFSLFVVSFLMSTNHQTRQRLIEITKEHNISERNRKEVMVISSTISFKNICKALICNLFTFCCCAILYYLAVGFCAVWKQWSHVLIILWLFTFITDFLIMEIILEMLVFLFYILTNKCRTMNKIHKFFLALRQLRNFG